MTMLRAGLLTGVFALCLSPHFGPDAEAQESHAPAPLELSLREAVQMALSPQGSLSIGIAGESIQVANAQQRQSRSAFLPDIDATVVGQAQLINLAAQGLQNINLPIPGFVFPQSSGSFPILDARVHLRQSVIDAAARGRIQAAGAGVESARVATDDVRDQVAAQVAMLYLAALRATSMMELERSVIAESETSLNEVTHRNGNGTALSIDVTQARVRLMSEKQRLMQLQMESSKASLALLSALNRDLDTPLELTEPLAFVPQDTPPPDDAIATALKARSDVAAQQRRLEAARLKDGAIHSERLPSLNAYADAGSIGTSIPNSQGTYDVGIALRVPVFDGRRRDSRREEVQAEVRQEQMRAALLKRQVELQVRQALLTLDVARTQVETAAAEVDVAQQQLAHRERRSADGLSVEMEKNEAQVSLARARDAQFAAFYGWNQARVELMQAMGTIRTLAQ